MKTLKLHYFLTDFIMGISLIWIPIYCRTFLGFSETQVGTLYLVGGVMSIFGSLINGYIAQKIDDERKVLNYGIISLIFGAIFLAIFKSFIGILLGFICIFYLKNILYIIGDEIALSYLKQQEKKDFGKIRSFGSLGWGANFIINGTLISIYPKLIFVSFLISACVLLINSFYLPHVVPDKEFIYKLSDTKKLWKYKNYILFLLAVSLMWSAANNMQTFIQYNLEDMKGSLQIFAYVNSLVIIFDMGIMRYSTQILEKIGGKAYFFIYMFVIFAKYLVLYMFASPIIIYSAVLFDPVFFGLMIPFTSMFVKSEIPRNLSTIALMIMQVITIFLVAIFAQIDGYIYQSFGSSFVYLIMLITTVIVILIGTKIKFTNLDKEHIKSVNS